MKQKITLIFLDYLRFFAKIQLVKISLIQKIKGQSLTIIGITGSTGKSTCLLATESILKNHFVVKTNNLANSETGIPLNILDLKPKDYSPLDWFKIALLIPFKLLTNWQSYQIYIVEMGIDGPEEPHNMSFLLKIIKPTIGVFLNVGQVHSMQFDPTVPKNITGNKRLHQIMLNIGTEKAKLINQLPSTGTAIINIVDPVIKKVVNTKAKIVVPVVQNITTDATGFSMVFKIKHENYQIKIAHYALSPAHAITFGCSLLVATTLGIEPKIAIKELENNLKLPPGRASLLQGIKNTTIIDSSYNSSPYATQQMLELLHNFSGYKIAVLGDMRELGTQSQQAHTELYKVAINTSDYVIGVGPETIKYFKVNQKCQTFNYWWQALAHLKVILKSKEIVLIKGSQNTIFTEEIVKGILKNPADVSLLCRQSPYWTNVKNNFQKANQSLPVSSTRPNPPKFHKELSHST